MSRTRGRRPARWLRRARSSRGSVAIEMVILLPVALALLFLVVQGAIYYQARAAAMSSAQHGATSAAAYQATDDMGRTRALEFVDQVSGNGVLDGATVDVVRDTQAGTVTVTVTGQTLSVVPGWDPEVSQSSTRSIEEFTRPEDYQRPGNPYGGSARYESRPMETDHGESAP